MARTQKKALRCAAELDCSPATQAIRIIDVVVLGPAMIAVGARRVDALGAFVAVAGITTMVFNADRFLRARRRRPPGN